MCASCDMSIHCRLSAAFPAQFEPTPRLGGTFQRVLSHYPRTTIIANCQARSTFKRMSVAMETEAPWLYPPSPSPLASQSKCTPPHPPVLPPSHLPHQTHPHPLSLPLPPSPSLPLSLISVYAFLYGLFVPTFKQLSVLFTRAALS